jgi:hypothetical protein
MANKFLTIAGLKAATAKSESYYIKHIVDGPLGEALKLYESEPEKPSEICDALDAVTKAALLEKRDKSVAADRALVKYLDDVIKAAAAERKKIETEAGELGLTKINVQIIVKDFEGELINGRKMAVKFVAPGTRDVLLNQDTKDGVLNFTHLSLAPHGTIYIYAFPSGGSALRVEGAEGYDLPKSPLVRFLATQKGKEIKQKATSATDVTKKAGLKGNIGIDWKVLTIGGEKSSEEEVKKSYGQEVEWVISVATGRFDIAMK